MSYYFKVTFTLDETEKQYTIRCAPLGRVIGKPEKFYPDYDSTKSRQNKYQGYSNIKSAIEHFITLHRKRTKEALKEVKIKIIKIEQSINYSITEFSPEFNKAVVLFYWER